jgi:hypothetical protein
MPPVTVPVIHVKLLGMDAVNTILGLVAVQAVAILGVVTIGEGLTDTLTEKAAHEPVAEVGVTRYSTVPTVRLLGLVNT